MELPDDLKNKLNDYIKPYVEAKETLIELEEYFDNEEHKPSGNYFPLAKYFQNKGANEDSIDEFYKTWLSEQIEKDKGCESFVLSCLKINYTTKEALSDFVFLTNYSRPELNQKWHFFISYWGLREYATLHPEKNIAANPITPLRKGFIQRIDCPELKYWYNNVNRNSENK